MNGDQMVWEADSVRQRTVQYVVEPNSKVKKYLRADEVMLRYAQADKLEVSS